MKLIEEDRLNLINFLSKTNCYEQLPEELEKGKIGLDRERWSNLIQKLIDNNKDS